MARVGSYMHAHDDHDQTGDELTTTHLLAHLAAAAAASSTCPLLASSLSDHRSMQRRAPTPCLFSFLSSSPSTLGQPALALCRVCVGGRMRSCTATWKRGMWEGSGASKLHLRTARLTLTVTSDSGCRHQKRPLQKCLDTGRARVSYGGLRRGDGLGVCGL